MSIWKRQATVQDLNDYMADSLASLMGIEFTERGEDFLAAKMPVDARTRQAYGILHGGASATLAETVGSIAGYLCVPENKYVVGLDLNCNHIRAMREGVVVGTARPLHLGSSTQVWDIRIISEEKKLVCVARLTLAVLHGQPTAVIPGGT